MIKRQPLREAPEADAARVRRLKGARKLRKLLAELPPSPYTEEETNQLIEEAVAATKGQYPESARANVARFWAGSLSSTTR